jgi:hypothetical protein
MCLPGFEGRQAIRNIEKAMSVEGGSKKGAKGRGLKGPTEKDMFLLIKMIDSAIPAWCEKAHTNLVVLTGADFRYDSVAWRKWFKANKASDRKSWMLAAMKGAGFAVDGENMKNSAPVFFEAMAYPLPGVRAAGYYLIRSATGKDLPFNVFGTEKSRCKQLNSWAAHA